MMDDIWAFPPVEVDQAAEGCSVMEGIAAAARQFYLNEPESFRFNYRTFILDTGCNNHFRSGITCCARNSQTVGAEIPIFTNQIEDLLAGECHISALVVQCFCHAFATQTSPAVDPSAVTVLQEPPRIG